MSFICTAFRWICKNGEATHEFRFPWVCNVLYSCQRNQLGNLFACFKFTWMNHKNRRHVCVWTKSTPLKHTVHHESKKSKKNRNITDETDTIRMGWSGSVFACVCVCFFLMPVKSDFDMYAIRTWWTLNTHTLPYLALQTRIEYLSTWITYVKKNSNHTQQTQAKAEKYDGKLISFCFCFR